MWKSEGDSAEREAASAVRQGVLRGKRRLAAVAAGALLGIAAIVAVYMAWRGAATMHDGEGAVATRHDPPACTMINRKIDKWLKAIGNRKSKNRKFCYVEERR